MTVAEEEYPEGAVDGRLDIDDEYPHPEHDAREAHGHGAQEIEQTDEPALTAVNLEGKNDGQDHRDRGTRYGEDEAVQDAVRRRLDHIRRPEEEDALVIQ